MRKTALTAHGCRVPVVRALALLLLCTFALAGCRGQETPPPGAVEPEVELTQEESIAKAKETIADRLGEEEMEGKVLVYEGEQEDSGKGSLLVFALGTGEGDGFVAQAHYALSSPGFVCYLDEETDAWEFYEQ